MTQREFFEAVAKLIGLYFLARSWITLFTGIGYSFYTGLESQIFGEYLLSAIPYMVVGLFLMLTSGWITNCFFPEKYRDDSE